MIWYTIRRPSAFSDRPWSYMVRDATFGLWSMYEAQARRFRSAENARKELVKLRARGIARGAKVVRWMA